MFTDWSPSLEGRIPLLEQRNQAARSVVWPKSLFSGLES